MSRVLVIGGSGHIGTYLIPSLVEQGHEVLSVSRGQAKRYSENQAAWDRVQQVVIDRVAEEAHGTFGRRIAELEPDIVVDLISFDLSSTQALVDALRGEVEHFLHCSSIWVHGHLESVPATEDAVLNPFGDYGIKKAQTDRWLLRQARLEQFPATVFRPGHIVGPGWLPISPYGNVDAEVFTLMAAGKPIKLPNFGAETLHHVHASDVAGFILQAILNRSASIGEAFNVVSEGAVSLRGYAEAMYRWFGHEPNVELLSFDEWRKTQSDAQAHHAWEHISRSHSFSIGKARRRVEYRPRYTSLEAIKESVAAAIARGDIHSP
ncbi:NAD-dependent epimerase/dehydratase family protein [Stenotrophomonas sp. S39]|uniref:NAD-dependent epimerase/dehydratase family protein n=1 Tax=Stenotrophomonas sp. S39 TaxID=2767451 RepID=UPI00190A450B|nr:NAD-dependent epimerase/dehydratase family protein [Stenotrophomonas sp. S39]MBK0053083.1 NAD-dependent epimerase/dehydratase family protein [Stenotrophomonas sp. S39]